MEPTRQHDALARHDAIAVKLAALSRDELMQWVERLDGVRNRRRADKVLAMLEVRARHETLAIEKFQAIAEARLVNAWHGGKLLPPADECKGGELSHRKYRPPQGMEVEIPRGTRDRWRLIASVVKKKLEAYVEACLKAGLEITFNGFIETVVNGPHVRGTFGTGENEWHTPREFLEMARLVLGEIDLDLASSDAAQKGVRAKMYFTKSRNGLKRKWQGRVWLNPPYAQPLIEQFIVKLLKECKAKRVPAAIALTHSCTDTRWFQAAAHACQGLCFTRGRIRFASPSGQLAAPTQAQAFVYFGPALAAFAKAFHDVGFLTGWR